MQKMHDSFKLIKFSYRCIFVCLYTLFRISHFIFCAVHIAHRVVLSVAFRVYTGEDAVAIKTEADSPHDGQLG